MLDISALRAKLYCLIYLLTFQIQCSQNCAISQQKPVCSCSCSLEGYLIPRAAIPSDMVQKSPVPLLLASQYYFHFGSLKFGIKLPWSFLLYGQLCLAHILDGFAALWDTSFRKCWRTQEAKYIFSVYSVGQPLLLTALVMQLGQQLYMVLMELNLAPACIQSSSQSPMWWWKPRAWSQCNEPRCTF